MTSALTVPTLSVVFMLVDLLAGIAIPVGLCLYFRRRYRCSLAAFFTGCGVMLVFALVLESLAHKLILGSAVGATIQASTWLYALYGGFMAGLFEESGRYVAFRTVLRKQRDNDHNALMYGAGHGGFEAFYLLGIGMINNLVYSILLNAGRSDILTAGLSGDALASVQAAFSALASTSPSLFLVSLLERVAAVAAQLSLSVLVWFAAKKGGRAFWLYPLAVALHLVLDAGAVILSRIFSQVLLVEAAVWAFAAVCVLTAMLVWRKNARPPAAEAAAPEI